MPLSESLHPLPPGRIEAADETDHEGDIYRGRLPDRKRHYASSTTPSVDSLASSTASSISFLGRGRLGAIAAVVEQAISRWARRNGPSSSTSSIVSLSSEEDDDESIRTRSKVRRLKRRLSVATLQSVRSERDFAAAMNRIKAREEARQIPREFTLYLPPLINPAGQLEHHRVIRDASPFSVLDQLGTVLSKSARLRRNQERQRVHKSRSKDLRVQILLPEGSSHAEDEPAQSQSENETLRAGRKGKHKASYDILKPAPAPTVKPKAWFLDVASPTWEDMRAIGKLLHLHPLTLEDILQREQREKLESFPKLGYYFISFRAIESRMTQRSKLSPQSEGRIGEGNIYIIIFEEGICTFHFTDMSEHINRIRNRILQLEETVSMSSEWIAHGILDSVVDSFFPYLEEIESEVMAIEGLVFSRDLPGPPIPTPQEVSHGKELSSEELREKWNEKSRSFSLDEKPTLQPTDDEVLKPRFRIPSQPFTKRPFERLWEYFYQVINRSQTPMTSPTALTLRRMARTRRLVVSLSRLLAMKSELVAQVRKRLSISGESDIAIYMGDIQDHIWTLQHSLLHYERMLSQSHPTYLIQLRTDVAIARSGADIAVFLLTIIAISVLCIQTLVGLVSMNVHIPTNLHEAGFPFNVFYIILALSLLILLTFLLVVRRWWIQAKRREGARALL
ncbi:hypothetical protein BDN72DRAFT_29453 [Pluteus cervinus]|uniref:Uncharacterized protein n=1 Tax=Pluteus cervinus TaxID=181527 RepID=A0ACD3BJ09_9AGAR|nr:hypothetical protein BDN72DRAFT_29453 [Pluteus cervinus]